jgi:hypothetical protein
MATILSLDQAKKYADNSKLIFIKPKGKAIKGVNCVELEFVDCKSENNSTSKITGYIPLKDAFSLPKEEDIWVKFGRPTYVDPKTDPEIIRSAYSELQILLNKRLLLTM